MWFSFFGEESETTLSGADKKAGIILKEFGERRHWLKSTR